MGISASAPTPTEPAAQAGDTGAAAPPPALGGGTETTTEASGAAPAQATNPQGLPAVDATFAPGRSPAWWQTRFQLPGDLPAQRLVDVPPRSAEYLAVERELKRTRPSCKVVKVQRNENMRLWHQLVSYRNMTSGVRGAAGLNELMMWHGTGGTDPDLMLKDGVDLRRGRPGSYGLGVYHASAASYSHNYAHRAGGHHMLILCRVIRGRFKEYGTTRDQSLRREPDGYDTVHSTADCRSGEHNCIVYQAGATYPEYLVTYD